jgi:hypothetical protein
LEEKAAEENEDPVVDGVLEEEGGVGVWASVAGAACVTRAGVRVLVREGEAEVEIEIEEGSEPVSEL